MRDSDHRIARNFDELLAIFHEVPHCSEANDAVVSAIAERMRTAPSAAPDGALWLTTSNTDGRGGCRILRSPAR